MPYLMFQDKNKLLLRKHPFWKKDDGMKYTADHGEQNAFPFVNPDGFWNIKTFRRLYGRNKATL